ncbi:PREDICTED: SUN domain-containing protein 2 [Nicrophorus vespilloides]|uniref:SUN domain-containing protein 2 n=1 Tax=Nicrophorus vespilloides TaxID=110193 RepID=A0ABM1NE37_NICVS|nr:PREDICTED: SUN domain-containing protein 2 [Nicrophorus vespilloides]
MALKLKKEIKKSSYYVWFLGAKEAKGLRGSEYILPIIENLEEREKDIEPFKVTLQVSHKGLKIVQNIVSQGNKKPKNETIKHFIPHNTITCVHQKDDIIACILLLFNPVTKCPLHVHAYRCDSLETASLLKHQLQTLIEKPENQKKFVEIEGRLGRSSQNNNNNNNSNKKFESSIGSDTGNSTRESESSEERFESTSRVATLYDSVAAELRAKLNKNDVPILLPPRDYDTVHRQKGNLTGIELRRCLNSNIVGQNVKGRRLESSGGSSGIGSDHAPSPESPPEVNDRYHGMDGHSTSDDDWNGDNETSLYLMDTVSSSLGPSSREEINDATIGNKYDYRVEKRNPRQFDQKASRQYLEEHIRKKLAARAELEESYMERYVEPQPKPRHHQSSERSRMERYQGESERRKEMKESYVDEEYEFKAPIPKARQKYHRDDDYYERQYYEDTLKKRAAASGRQRSPSPKYVEDIPVSPRDRFKDAKEKFLLLERERIDQELRARKEAAAAAAAAAAAIPTAKERKAYYKSDEQPISPVHKEKHYIKRQESVNYNNDRYNYESEREGRYYDDRYGGDTMPKPAPRTLHTEEVRYRRGDQQQMVESSRYKEKYDPKRRSMFNLSIEDHKRNQSEIAKELKRRSYMEQQTDDFYNDGHFSKSNGDLDQVSARYDSSKYVKNQKSSNYRNSYAEPKYNSRSQEQQQQKKYEMLHRTNSSVSNSNGRVGIASVHPY